MVTFEDFFFIILILLTTLMRLSLFETPIFFALYIGILVISGIAFLGFRDWTALLLTTIKPLWINRDSGQPALEFTSAILRGIRERPQRHGSCVYPYPGLMVQSGASAANREVRVLARGRPSNHATSRSTLIAAAMATLCTWVFDNPRYRVRLRPQVRIPWDSVPSIPARRA